MGRTYTYFTKFEFLFKLTNSNRYAGGSSAKNEVKTLDGITRGSYSYIDAESKLQTVEYVADALGFRVAATNLPVPPVDNNVAPVDNAQPPLPVEDTAEVKIAREEHLKAISAAKTRSSSSESSEPEAEVVATPLEEPKQVDFTPEVKNAREEHLNAVEIAKARTVEADTVVVSQPQLIQAPVVFPQTATIHFASSPLAVWKSQPVSSFGYSILQPGFHQIIAV